MNRRLYRSRNNRMLAGVCGGMGEYFNIDPTIVRLIAAVLLLTTISFWVYIICILIIPNEGRF